MTFEVVSGRSSPVTVTKLSTPERYIYTNVLTILTAMQASSLRKLTRYAVGIDSGIAERGKAIDSEQNLADLLPEYEVSITYARLAKTRPHFDTTTLRQ